MSDSDPSFRSVRAVIAQAMDAGARISVILRGDPLNGRPARVIEGVPVAFSPTHDGRDRVVLEVVADATVQIVLIERIVRVVPAMA